jgi:pseudouridine-5'-phosphate glycosidase
MADRLSLAHAIENSGVARDAAEAIAGEVDELIRENVATKADITLLRAEIKAGIAAVRAELKADIAVRGELKTDIAAVRAELDLVRHQLTTWLGGLVVVVAGLLFAALHYWPPHG